MSTCRPDANLGDGRPGGLQKATVGQREEQRAVQQQVHHDTVADAAEQALPRRPAQRRNGGVGVVRLRVVQPRHEAAARASDHRWPPLRKIAQIEVRTKA